MSATMLPHVWALRDVADVEALCRGALAEMLRRTNVELQPADYDDALAFLLGEVVVLERQFDGRPGIEFRPWLYRLLKFRCIDYWRSWYGRHGQHRVVDLRPGGQATADAAGGCATADADGARVDRLDNSIAGGESSSPEACADALLGFLKERDREALREERRLGFGPREDPPRRDQDTTLGTARRHGDRSQSASREADRGEVAA